MTQHQPNHPIPHIRAKTPRHTRSFQLRKKRQKTRNTSPGELDLLNQLWEHANVMVNLFEPQQKLIHKTRDGAKITKKHDTAATPLQRLTDFTDIINKNRIKELGNQYRSCNIAQLRRDMTDLQTQLTTQSATKTITKRAKRNTSYLNHTRTLSDEATTPSTRTS